MYRTSTYTLWGSQKENREKRAKSLFEKNITENFPTLKKGIVRQIKEQLGEVQSESH